jgi:hypothetical protein
VALLAGRCDDEDLLVALGGPHAALVLAGDEGGTSGYWPRVWAARGLLYAWADSAIPAVIEATADSAWRVREMALKVIARRLVGDGLEVAAALRADQVPRVCRAAERALARLTAAGA